LTNRQVTLIGAEGTWISSQQVYSTELTARLGLVWKSNSAEPCPPEPWNNKSRVIL